MYVTNILPTTQVANSVTSAASAANPSALGYNASLSDISAFNASLQSAEEKATASTMEPEIAESTKAVAKPLDDINQEAIDIIDYAKNAVASKSELTPSEIVMLTARSQQFMFHCQLTANIANRTSDGIQQLFRQQS